MEEWMAVKRTTQEEPGDESSGDRPVGKVFTQHSEGGTVQTGL